MDKTVDEFNATPNSALKGSGGDNDDTKKGGKICELEEPTSKLVENLLSPQETTDSGNDTMENCASTAELLLDHQDLFYTNDNFVNGANNSPHYEGGKHRQEEGTCGTSETGLQTRKRPKLEQQRKICTNAENDEDRWARVCDEGRRKMRNLELSVRLDEEERLQNASTILFLTNELHWMYASFLCLTYLITILAALANNCNIRPHQTLFSKVGSAPNQGISAATTNTAQSAAAFSGTHSFIQDWYRSMSAALDASFENQIVIIANAQLAKKKEWSGNSTTEAVGPRTRVETVVDGNGQVLMIAFSEETEIEEERASRAGGEGGGDGDGSSSRGRQGRAYSLLNLAAPPSSFSAHSPPFSASSITLSTASSGHGGSNMTSSLGLPLPPSAYRYFFPSHASSPASSEEEKQQQKNAQKLRQPVFYHYYPPGSIVDGIEIL